MNFIWWYDSVGLRIHQHGIINRRKRREKESLDKKKRRWKETDVVSLVFLVHHKCIHIRSKEHVSVWIRRKWWWGSGRQGEKSGRKRGGKKGKGKKWFWQKSFLSLFDCVFASSLFPCTHHTTTPQHTLSLTHTLYNIAHLYTVTCKQGCVLVLLWAHGPFQQNCDDVIFFFAIRGFLLPNSFFYDQPKIFFAICSLRKNLYFAIRGFSD